MSKNIGKSNWTWNWGEDWICTDCGETVQRGLQFWGEHSNICKANAPNVNIESYHRNQELETIQRKVEREFDKVWKQMTDEEQYELLILSCSGISLGTNVIGMGLEQFAKVQDFRDKMIQKYKK